MPHTARAAALLATVGLRDASGLWSLATNGDGDHVSRTAARLALACATAVDNLQEAERAAAAAIASLHGFASDEVRAGNADGRRDASHVTAAATLYAKQCERIERADAAFRACAGPLAELLGLDALITTTTAR